jgi:hypothetical protein
MAQTQTKTQVPSEFAHHFIAGRYFSAVTRRRLTRAGWTIVGSQMSDPYQPVPYFEIVRDGCSFCKSFAEVLELAR